MVSVVLLEVLVVGAHVVQVIAVVVVVAVAHLVVEGVVAITIAVMVNVVQIVNLVAGVVAAVVVTAANRKTVISAVAMISIVVHPMVVRTPAARKFIGNTKKEKWKSSSWVSEDARKTKMIKSLKRKSMIISRN